MTAPGTSPDAAHQQEHDTPRVRWCSKGHPKDSSHVDRVRLNLPTTAEEWTDAIRLGYCSDRRAWDGRERRRSW